MNRASRNPLALTLTCALLASGISCGDDAPAADASTGMDAPAAQDASPDTSPDTTASDTGGATDGGMGAAFGAACTQATDCASGLCETFPMVGKRCTQSCTKDSDCPAGSMGQKCNLNGFCRP